MPRRIILSIVAIAVSGMTARAADLPAQSQIGAIFAEPAVVPPAAYREHEYAAPIIPYNGLPNPIWAQGGYDYGSSWSYYYGGPYYGGPFYSGPYTSYTLRLPYACGFYGYC
jgi:hypothetical protein